MTPEASPAPRWHHPSLGINPFAPPPPPPEPWELGHHEFRRAYDRARHTFEADTAALAAQLATAGSSDDLAHSPLFIAGVDAAQQILRHAAPPTLHAAVAHAIAVIAWGDTQRDLATRPPAA